MAYEPKDNPLNGVEVEGFKKKEWVHGWNNEMLRGDGFYISYNPGNMPLVMSDETALVKDNTFFILNGDWRDDYEAIIDDGYDACVAFFQKNNFGENVNNWSN